MSRPQSILVEGVDRSGKTTLVSHLSEAFGLDCIKLRHQEDDQFARYRSFYGTGSHAIFDRGHVSESLYSPLFNRPLPFTEREEAELDRFVASQMIVIFCLPPRETGLRRLAEQHKAALDVITERDWLRSWELFETTRKKFPGHLLYRGSEWSELTILTKKLQKRLPARATLYQ